MSSNARLIPSIDTKNSLLCGFGSGLTDLAAKKTKFFKYKKYRANLIFVGTLEFTIIGHCFIRTVKFSRKLENG